MGLFATSGSVARVVGPLVVTEIYEQFGTYVMFGAVTATLAVSLIFTLFSYTSLVPSHGKKKDENQTDDANKTETFPVPEEIISPTMKEDSKMEKNDVVETAPKEIGKRLPIFSEEDEEDSESDGK